MKTLLKLIAVFGLTGLLLGCIMGLFGCKKMYNCEYTITYKDSDRGPVKDYQQQDKPCGEKITWENSNIIFEGYANKCLKR
jgi:hypothetical protein